MMELASLDILESEKFRLIEERRKFFWPNLLWRSVAEYLAIPSSDASVTKIAEFFGASVADVVEAVEGLERLQVIERTRAGWDVKDLKDLGEGADPKDSLRDQVLLSAQTIEKLSNSKRQLFYTTVLATSRAEMRSFMQEYQALCDRYNKQAKLVEKESIFVLNMNIVDLNIPAQVSEETEK